jgi:hypothetical protein
MESSSECNEEPLNFLKRSIIYSLAERLLVSQEELCYMEMVIDPN